MDAPTTLVRYTFDRSTFDELRARVNSGALDPEANRLANPPAPLRVPPVDLRPGGYLAESNRDHRVARGEAALREGKVAIVVLNGGMATRFGGGAKGVVPIVEGDVRASFLAVKLAQVRRAAERLGARIPAVVMHSFATQERSEQHLADIDWSGLPPEDRLSFAQSVMPRVLPDGTSLMELPEGERLSANELLCAPGHGDTLGRLRGSGVMARLRERGVEHVLLSNVDNLGADLDPHVLGAHLESVDKGSGVTVEVVRREAGDAGGCVAELADGRPAIIEGFRLPKGTDLADYPHFNTNTLWLRLSDIDREIDLQWFAVRKKIAWPPSVRTGPDGMLEVVQFETLVGQVTEFVPTSFVDVDRAVRFCPIKVQADLQTQRELLQGYAQVLYQRG